MKKTFGVAVLAFTLCMGFALAAWSQAKPEILVKQRQAAMTLLGKYFGPLGGMAQGKITYNAEIAVRNAAYVDVLIKMPWDGFDPNTAGVKSEALPGVYSNAAKFKKAAESTQAAVARLVTASKSGDETAIKAAIGAVGKSCGSCHDDFREHH